MFAMAARSPTEGPAAPAASPVEKRERDDTEGDDMQERGEQSAGPDDPRTDSDRAKRALERERKKKEFQRIQEVIRTSPAAAGSEVFGLRGDGLPSVDDPGELQERLEHQRREAEKGDTEQAGGAQGTARHGSQASTPVPEGPPPQVPKVRAVHFPSNPEVASQSTLQAVSPPSMGTSVPRVPIPILPSAPPKSAVFHTPKANITEPASMVNVVQPRAPAVHPPFGTQGPLPPPPPGDPLVAIEAMMRGLGENMAALTRDALDSATRLAELHRDTNANFQQSASAMHTLRTEADEQANIADQRFQAIEEQMFEWRRAGSVTMALGNLDFTPGTAATPALAPWTGMSVDLGAPGINDGRPDPHETHRERVVGSLGLGASAQAGRPLADVPPISPHEALRTVHEETGVDAHTLLAILGKLEDEDSRNAAVKLFTSRAQTIITPSKEIRNQVSTEKLKDQEEYKGALNRKLLEERLWFRSEVKCYMEHASPAGGTDLFDALDSDATIFAGKFSRATTGERRAAIIKEMDQRERIGLGHEFVYRFPAVLKRALNKAAITFYNEHFLVTPDSHTRGKYAELVMFRVASMLGNGPNSIEQWAEIASFVEKPYLVFYNASPQTILMALREWRILAEQTIQLQFTNPTRIGRGMKKAYEMFFRVLRTETQYELMGKGIRAEGLDDVAVTWDKLLTIHNTFYERCSITDSEPELRTFLSRTTKSANVSHELGNAGFEDLTGTGEVLTDPQIEPSKVKPHSASAGGTASAAGVKQDNSVKQETKPTAQEEHVRKSLAAGLCYSFRDTGTCSYGEKCAFKHEPKGHTAQTQPSNVMTLDPDTITALAAAVAAKGGKGKGQRKREGKGGNPKGKGKGDADVNGPGVCMNCGSKDHYAPKCDKPMDSNRPCWYFHVSKDCRAGDKCKWSHNPIKEGSKPPGFP